MKTLFSMLFLMTSLSIGMSSQVWGQAEAERQPPDTTVLEDQRWEQVDAAVERSLTWLATQQAADGSFESPESGQPGVTSLCLMAFLAQGEGPANGKYQQQLTNAVKFIADQQKPNGLIGTNTPGAVPIPRIGFGKTLGSPSVYNHAISGLALCEAYGQCNAEQAELLAPVIEKAVAATLEMQGWAHQLKHNEGGWRYLDLRFPTRSGDLSITGWQLMFLRSARNAGFDVPEKSIDAAVKFVEGCFLKGKERNVHAYLPKNKRACTRAMAGAGVLALAHAGKHDSKEAVASGEWILNHDFSNYNDDTPIFGAHWADEHYHYASFLCSQAMFQLGGKYWKEFYPPLIDILLTNQQDDGAWPREKAAPQYGSCYTTSLSILAISVPNQMLPIFQR